MPKTTNGYGYAPDYITDQVTVMRPTRSGPGDVPKVIFFQHGVTGSSLDIMQPGNGLYWHIKALADAGYVVIGSDWGGPQHWSGPYAMSKFPWMLALAQSSSIIGTIFPIGGHTPKIALLGGSMGGLTSLNLYKRFTSSIAGALLYNPVTDLRWADTEAGYTPAYATGGLVGSWSAAITTAYPINTLITGTVTINQVAVTIPAVATAAFAASGTIVIAGQNITYTGKTATTFTGCTVASGSIVTANNWLVTQGTGAYANSAGYRVVDEYATWHGAGMTIRVIHASDDAVVPNAASSAFVTGVNDPGVTFRLPQPTGGHVNVFQNVPVAETVAFFNALSW